MNTKLLALLFGIFAAALTQAANACVGCEGTTEKPKKGKKTVEPEPELYVAAEVDGPPEDEEEEEEEVEEEVEEEDGVDYEDLRKQSKKLVGNLFTADASNKKKVKALLDKLGEANIGDMENDNLPKFIAGLKKLGA